MSLICGGLIRHIGFSFHSTPQELEKILNAHPEMEFVQLQINYGDWENPAIQSRACYEVARAHGKPVIIMEPVKGGMLANPPEPVKEIFKQAEPDASCASWAIRFAADLPGIITVLSGMSSMEQMEDNLSVMKDFNGLSPEEKKMFLQLVSVSGVGAKMGIAVLSAMNVGDIAVAIASSDVRRLTSVKGLGKKTAERIILELREKVSAAQLPAEQGGKSAAAPQRVSDKEEDAVVGLMSLGYTRAESVRAVRGAIEGGADSMEEIIMTALRSM